MVKITIVGTGYVGLVSGTCLAESGHDVICSDISEEKINMLKKGKCPIYELGLQELLDKNIQNGRLTFTTDVSNAIQKSEVIFSAVGTPPDENHKADLQYVKAVAKTFAENLNEYKVFVNKSTVPVGTGEMVKQIIEEIAPNKDFDVISNPEFLKEGAAVKDFQNPDRIVIGCESKKAKEMMGEVYLPYSRAHSPIFYTNIKTAELIKYAANSMLATRISFMNEIARFCDIVGANVADVSKGIGMDARIGPKFLQAGAGYGGSCFPKDVNALIESGKEKGYNFEILQAVESVNFDQKTMLVEKILEKNNNDLSGQTITIWGLAFKPKTDDVRESPSYYIIKKLIEKGAKVQVFDPIAQENFEKQNPGLKIEYYKDNYEALENSDSLMVITEWDEFRILDFEKMKSKMKRNIICDGRNIYNPQKIKEEGFEYIGLGRN